MTMAICRVCHAIPCALEWWKVCWEQPEAAIRGTRQALDTSCMGDETNICMYPLVMTDIAIENCH